MSASDDLPGRGIYQPLNPPEPVPAPPLPEELEEDERRTGQYGSGQYDTDYDDYDDYGDYDDYDDYGEEDEYDPEDTDPGRTFRGIGAPGGYVGPPGPDDTDPGTRAGSTTVDGATEHAAGSSIGVSGGRHARRGHQSSAPIPLPKMPRLDYMPRHAASPDVAPVSPTDLTEILARVREDPTEKPRPDRPESARVPPAALPETPVASPAPQDTQPGKRVRVVLSQRPGQSARPVRTVVDVREVTQVGEVLSSSLIRSQLALALRIAAIALLGLGALPAMFFYVPRLGAIEVFGVRLPWLLLGFVVYPFLLLLGWMYVRAADKLEQIFADHIQG